MIINISGQEYNTEKPENMFVNADCMDFLHLFPDKYFDLGIVDPPYGLPKDSSNGRGKLKSRAFNMGGISRWDIAPDEHYFKELFRVTKNQIIWGGNYFNLPPSRCVIVWDKEQPWENFSQVEIAWTSFSMPASIFHFDNRTGGKIHPVQKPIELYMWLIGKYAKDGDLILDTHVGSASSLIACYETNHKYFGFEIDPDYYADATERLNEAQSQMNIFEYIQMGIEQ